MQDLVKKNHRPLLPFSISKHTKILPCAVSGYFTGIIQFFAPSQSFPNYITAPHDSVGIVIDMRVS